MEEGKAGGTDYEECTGGVDLKPQERFSLVTEVLWRSFRGRREKEREVAETLLRCKGRGSARLMAEE